MIPDPDDDSVGFLGATIPCPCCRDGKIVDDSDRPPLPHYIIDEMRRHFFHVIDNRDEYLGKHEKKMALRKANI